MKTFTQWLESAELPTVGYVFKRKQLTRIVGDHSNALGPIDVAVREGAVRIRDHGMIVSFQGRSKWLVDAAITAFSLQIRPPRKITVEWPGHYSENYLGSGW